MMIKQICRLACLQAVQYLWITLLIKGVKLIQTCGYPGERIPKGTGQLI
jgi:hypothetical protein